MTRQLRKKQKEFCKHYFTTGNAYQAALKAGYAESTAKLHAKDWLDKPNFISYLEEFQEKDEYSFDAYILELDKAIELAYKTQNASTLIKVIETKGKAFGYDKMTVSDTKETSQNVVKKDLFEKIQEKANVFKKFEQSDTTSDLSDNNT